jgi:hypothetical protein
MRNKNAWIADKNLGGCIRTTRDTASEDAGSRRNCKCVQCLCRGSFRKVQCNACRYRRRNLTYCITQSSRIVQRVGRCRPSTCRQPCFVPRRMTYSFLPRMLRQCLKAVSSLRQLSHRTAELAVLSETLFRELQAVARRWSADTRCRRSLALWPILNRPARKRYLD